MYKQKFRKKGSLKSFSENNMHFFLPKCLIMNLDFILFGDFLIFFSFNFGLYLFLKKASKKFQLIFQNNDNNIEQQHERKDGRTGAIETGQENRSDTGDTVDGDAIGNCWWHGQRVRVGHGQERQVRDGAGAAKNASRTTAAAARLVPVASLAQVQAGEY